MAHFLTLRSWDLGLRKFPVCPPGPTGQAMGQLWASGPGGLSTWTNCVHTLGSQCPNAWDLGPRPRHWDKLGQGQWTRLAGPLGPSGAKRLEDNVPMPGTWDKAQGKWTKRTVQDWWPILSQCPVGTWDNPLGQKGTGPKKKNFGQKFC